MDDLVNSKTFFHFITQKFLGMNLEKRENINYRTADKVEKLVNTKFYKRHEPVYFDGECRFFEVVTKKRAIKDKIRISTAFYILGNAKLCVLEFVRDLEKCLIPSAMRILYMGR